MHTDWKRRKTLYSQTIKLSVHVEILENLLELCGFSKVLGYKVNIQNYIVFLYTCSEQLEIQNFEKSK